MFDKYLPTFDVILAFMLFLIIYIAQAASKFGESKHSAAWILAKKPPLSVFFLNSQVLQN